MVCKKLKNTPRKMMTKSLINWSLPTLLSLTLLIASLAWAALEITAWKGHQNGKVIGFEKTDLAMFTAEPQSSKFFTEVWFHEMQFKDEGIIVTINFQFNNLGLSSGYCQTIITVSDPKSGFLSTMASYGGDEVKFDDKGFGLTAGTNRIELKGDTYRIVYKGDGFEADMTYNILAPSYQQGDGKTVFVKSGDWVRYNFPIPWAEISGTLTYNGKTHRLTGVGSMNHDRQILLPTRFMLEWRAYWMYTETETIGIVMCRSADLDGKWMQRLVVAERGKILFSSHDFAFEESDLKPVPGGNVPCPENFKIDAVHGEDWLKGGIKVVSIQEKKDIADEFPAVLRPFASLVVSETWSYRFWMDFDFELKLDGKTRRIKGRGAGNMVNSVEAE